MFMSVVSSFRSRPELRNRPLICAAAGAMAAGVMVIAPAALVAQIPAAQAQTVPAAPTAPAGPQSFAGVVRSVKPAVISVRVKMTETNPEDLSSPDNERNEREETRPPFFRRPPFDRFFRDFGAPNSPDGRVRPRLAMAQGSGFFISRDGYAVTNSHVVSDSNSVEVQTDDEKTYKARVVGTDPKTDVALLKVDGNDFPYVAFAQGIPEIGDWVIAVGNPYGLGGSVTAGIISARGRDIGSSPYDDFLQIDAPVNKGNSGGPAFNENGQVVGVTTAIFSPSGGSVGIGFAIPADTVKSVVNQLKSTGQVTRGWIGVQIQPVTEEIASSLGLRKAEGALVDEPQADGPAIRAGIKSGDVIQSVNGETVKDSRDLAKRIAGLAPGQTATIGLVQDGAEKTVTLQIAKMPDRTAAENRPNRENRGGGNPQLGLTLAPAASVNGQGTPGVIVTDVDPNGPAAERGVHAGDIILEVA
ncbi:MAG: trypsin-like peptidase domain-containing protein, partial [Bradyrhizobiaceae bacterium]|nr:trypsin-like peptidase domain-containing protein [Bradyrhizobiaceae bacterium]